jgi:hypothetical protein
VKLWLLSCFQLTFEMAAFPVGAGNNGGWDRNWSGLEHGHLQVPIPNNRSVPNLVDAASVGWLAGWLAVRFGGWLAVRFGGWLAVRLAGSLFSWSAGWLVCFKTTANRRSRTFSISFATPP